MKKKNYNKFTKNDLPLDSFTSYGKSIVSRKLNQGEKIIGIGTNSVEKLNKHKLAKQQKIKEAKQSKLQQQEMEPVVQESYVERIEKINEDTLDNYNNRNKRNQVIIIILSAVLALMMITLTIYFTFIRTEPNCFLYLTGDAKAEYLVNGLQINEFTAPKDIEGDSILKVDIEVKINSLGDYRIKFAIRCYNRDTLLPSTEAYLLNDDDPNFELVDGFYVSTDIVKYGDTVRLCGGVAINESDIYVDHSNFRMEVHTHFEKV